MDHTFGESGPLLCTSIRAGRRMAEEPASGANAAMDAPVGPSHRVAVAAGLLAEEGTVVQCVIVDFSATAALPFSPMIGGLEPGTLVGFDPASPDLSPAPKHLRSEWLFSLQRRRQRLLPRRSANSSRWGYRFRAATATAKAERVTKP